MLSKANITAIPTSDLVAPAEGQITSAGQLDNANLFIEGSNPAFDATEPPTPLSELKARVQVYSAAVNGANPFVTVNPDNSTTVKSSDEIFQMAQNGGPAMRKIVPLNVELEAGAAWRDELPIPTPGPTYFVATMYSDVELV